MITETTLKAVLAADTGAGGFATLLTGGIYTRSELKRPGLTQKTAPGAWSGPVMLPCCLIRERSNVPDNQINDAGAQVRSKQKTFLIVLYSDGDGNRSTLEAANARLFVLLEGKRFSGSALIDAGTIWGHEEALNNAHMGRATYYAYGVT